MASEFEIAQNDEVELIEELGHEEPGAHEVPFPPFDPEYFVPQFIWLVITFGLLYLLMSRVALPRVAGIIENRRERVAGDLNKAAELKAQTDEAIAIYEQGLADARAKAHGIAAVTRESMKAEAEELRANIDAKLEEQLEAAEERIGSTKEKALANVRDVAAETAVIIVHRLTGEATEPQGVVTAVDKVLAGGRS